MLSLNLNNTKHYLWAALGLSAVFLIFQLYSFVLVGLLFLSLAYVKYKDKLIISLSIFFYLIITSDFAEVYRDYINIIFLSALIIIFVKNFGFNKKSLAGFPKEIYYLLTIIFLSFIISSLFSSNIVYSLVITFRQLIFFVIVYVFYMFLIKKNYILLFITTLSLVSFVLGIEIIYQIITQGFVLYSAATQSFIQFEGLYSNPNTVGLLLAVSIPMYSYFLFLPENRKGSRKLLFISGFIFLIAILFLTNSRAAIGSFIITFLYVLSVLSPKYFKFTLISFMLLTLIIFLVPAFRELFDIYFRVSRIFENTRYDIWSMAWQIIKEHPVFGVGPEQFATKIYTYLPVMLGSFEEHQIWWAKSGTAHNFFLFKFAEGGLLGIFSAILLFVIFFYFAFKTQKLIKQKNSAYYFLAVIITGIGFGLLGRSFFETSGLLTNGWITRDLPFWLCFIILLTVYNKFNKINTFLENKI